MKQISIIGFGRFGKTLYRLLQNDFAITIYNRTPVTDLSLLNKSTKIAKTLEEAYANDTIFYAVPISAFEEVIKTHKKYFKPSHLLIDVLTVKVYPANILKKYLEETQTQALLTHPMFGPDSSKDGFEELPLIIDQFLSDQTQYHFWKTYFTGKKLHVVEMSPDQHDEISANSLGVTHFIGRLLEKIHFEKTPIDSLGVKKLLEVKTQTCNDTWELFTNLQTYNPYTKDMRIALGNAYDKLYNTLLPEQVNPDKVTFGIQGGKGSFNEEALLYYVQRARIESYDVKYLHTSDRVLEALHRGEIDKGQFAIYNSVGGIVDESITAMAAYRFAIVDKFAIKISHALMIRQDAQLSDIDTIMTHPQVLRQCKQTLEEKYPNLKQTSGEDELVDHALVAECLSKKKLPKNIAVMGSKVLAKIYDLKIVEDNLQDAEENYTSFMQVARELA